MSTQHTHEEKHVEPLGKNSPQSHREKTIDHQVREVLIRVQRSVEHTKEAQISLPSEGQLRMRKLVHRGTQRPVFKFSALKLRRTVQCESILECDAALLLDVSPRCQGFVEQPARIRYQASDGNWCSHVPDFFAVIGGTPAFWEIKFQKDVDNSVLERSELLRSVLRKVGCKYQLLTEGDIRRGAVLQNATSILRRARHSLCEIRALRVLNKLKGGGGFTLADFEWTAGSSLDAACVAQLIFRGAAVIDVLPALTGKSNVRLMGQDDEEGATWLPAVSL